MDYKQEEIAYFVKILNNIETEFRDYFENMLFEHLNNMYKKYNNWKKYPRRVKKFLKSTGFWNVKNIEPIKPKVEMNI